MSIGIDIRWIEVITETWVRMINVVYVSVGIVAAVETVILHPSIGR